MDNIYILVPSYNPDEEIMTKFINELKKSFNNILIVNDGSINKSYFDNLQNDGFEVITNYVNLGKGRALKNGINYLLNKDQDIEGIVTCDCDGQHSVKDIKKIANKISIKNDELILGVRKFNDKKVPLKSKFGNNITKSVFKMFVGLYISDTQTGLRGMNRNLMISFLDVFGERYEYETKVLIKCKTDNIKIEEVPIETIYINNNMTSHFNPIKDSIRIYKLFTKYILASFSSFIIDLIGFIIAYIFTNNIILSTVIARIISSIWNYNINAKLVFKRMNKRTIILYYLLVIIQMFTSAILVSYGYKMFDVSVVWLKILIDFGLFIINYFVEKNIIFTKGFK